MERHVLARARFHQLAVFAENAAKSNVAEVGRVTLAARDRDDLFEVQDLRRADDQPNRICFQIPDSIIHRRDVGGRIIETAIPFANNGRLFGQLRDVAEENADRAFAHLGDSRFEQTLDHRGQPVVVETFPPLDVVMNVQHLIGVVEFFHRKVDRLFPNREILRVAGLEFDQFLADRLSYFEVACRFFIGLLVDANQFRDRIAFERSAVEQIFPAVDHHPELGAPIADVIVANDLVTEKRRDPRERIAQHRAADVAHVHRLRHIGRTEIDHDPLRRRGFFHAEPFVAQQIGRPRCDDRSSQREVNEAGSGDRRRLAYVP